MVSESVFFLDAVASLFFFGSPKFSLAFAWMLHSYWLIQSLLQENILKDSQWKSDRGISTSSNRHLAFGHTDSHVKHNYQDQGDSKSSKISFYLMTVCYCHNSLLSSHEWSAGVGKEWNSRLFLSFLSFCKTMGTKSQEQEKYIKVTKWKPPSWFLKFHFYFLI